MNNDLKPCPFCGGAALLEETPFMFQVYCDNPDCRVFAHVESETQEDAAGIWNARTPLPEAAEKRAAVGGEWMSTTIANHVARCERLIAEEQEKVNPDNVLIVVLADSVRMTREYARVATSPLSPLAGSTEPKP